MKIGIVGSGFGMYGYLPAIILGGNVPVTLEKYRATILHRVDIQQFDDQIQYVSNFERLVEDSTDALVLAVPPLVGRQILGSFRHSYPSHLFLEKPIASSRQDYADLTEQLSRVANTWSVAYLFPYTEWYREMQSWVSKSSGALEVTIQWTLPKPESRDNWKVDKLSGGGIVSFYLSHFIPFLRENDFDTSNFSLGANGDVIWEIRKNGPKGYRLAIRCEYGDRLFSVSVSEQESGLPSTRIYQHDTPFGPAPQPRSIDVRSAMLLEYMSEVLDNPRLATRNQLGDSKAIDALCQGHRVDDILPNMYP